MGVYNDFEFVCVCVFVLCVGVCERDREGGCKIGKPLSAPVSGFKQRKLELKGGFQR